MKTITFIRHAKAVPMFNGDDFERPLSDVGRREADVLSDVIKQDNVFMPELSICSPAVRTIQTYGFFSDKLNLPADSVIFNEMLYSSSSRVMADYIENLSDKYKNIMILGHNPMMSDLVCFLGGTSLISLPTCSVVKIEFDVNSWKDIMRISGKVKFYGNPIKYRSLF